MRLMLHRVLFLKTTTGPTCDAFRAAFQSSNDSNAFQSILR